MSAETFNYAKFCDLIVDHISDGLLVVQNNKILLCNHHISRMLGFSNEELRNTPFSDLFFDPDAADPDKILHLNTADHNTIARFRTKLLGKHKHVLPAELTIQSQTGAQQRYLLVLVREDVDAQLSERIGAGEDRYKTLWDLSPSGIILEDAEGTIIDVNPAFCRCLGYEREDLIGKPVHILAHPEKQEDVTKNIRELLAGKVLKHNAKSIARDGTLHYMELHETMVVMPNGAPGILSIAADVTEQLRADEEKLKREKMQSVLEIAGAVCHELNQPMTVVSVNCDLILMDHFTREEIYEKIEVVRKQLNRMSDITKKLMHITRYETRDYLSGTRIVDIDRATGYKTSEPSRDD